MILPSHLSGWLHFCIWQREDTAVVKAQTESAHDHQSDRGRFSVPCHTSLAVGRLPIWGVSLFIPVESAVSTINSIDISGVAIMTRTTKMLTLPR